MGRAWRTRTLRSCPDPAQSSRSLCCMGAREGAQLPGWGAEAGGRAQSG